MPTLTVDLNRDGVYTVSAPDSFSTTRPFTIELDNHGQPVHVHLNADDRLSSVASLTMNNRYVESESRRMVSVRSAEPTSPTTGRLKIVVGHGATTAYVDVTVEPPSDERNPVQVDESLTRPPRPDPEPSLFERLSERSSTGEIGTWGPAVAFILVAVTIAIAIGLSVGGSVVLFGTSLVIGAALVAGFFAFR